MNTNLNAIAQDILDKSTFYNLHIIRYYDELQPNNVLQEKQDRLIKLNNCNKSMSVRYISNIYNNDSSNLYKSYVNDSSRIIITRWRLSNFKLHIERGKYTRPITPRNLRKCFICEDIEDEQHVIFKCPIYSDIRNTYREIIRKKS